MGAPQQPKQTRIVELDALRGLAAASVLVYHYTFQVGELVVLDEYPAFAFERGNVGVQLFFIISGFVIARSLTHSRGAVDFAVRRASRLFPTYWVAVLLTSAVVGAFGLATSYFSVPNTLANLTMLQHHARIDHVDGVYWSLAVELSFYLIAYLAHALGWLRRSLLALTCTGWLTAAAVWTVLPEGGVGARLDDLLVLRWGHFFAAGMAMAALADSRDGGVAQGVGRWPLVAVIVAAPVVEQVHATPISPVVVALLVGLAAVAVFLRPAALRWRPLVWLGGVSYALYLIHQYTGYIIIRELADLGVDVHVAVVAATVVVLLLAWVLTVLVDRPAQQVLRTWWRGRRPAVAPT